MTVRILLSALFVLCFGFNTAFARHLDYIDADGVTETGGAGKARMIPRTKADGLLDASLLPPVADWGSQPVPGLRYVSPGAAAGGNGSSQYPYNSLATAFAEAPSGTALLLAPASYDADVTLAGKALTLVGYGAATRLEHLTVSVGGTSSLSFVGCSAGVVTVNGAALPMRLHGTVVDAVHGTSPVTLVRMDMGSYVRAWTTTGAHTERYDGYDLVTNAVVLVGPDASLRMGADRPVVTVGDAQQSVAYVAELTDATNQFHVAVTNLIAADSLLATNLASEVTLRSNEIVRVEGCIASTSAVLRTEIEGVDAAAQAQASVLSTTISQVAGAFTNLSAALQASVHAVSGRVETVNAAYQQADAELRLDLTSDYQEAVEDVRADIPVIADEHIDTALEPVSETLSALIDTVTANHEAHVATEEMLQERINALVNEITQLKIADAALMVDLKALTERVNAYHGTPQ